MRVLVTGASGYIGSRVAAALMAAGHEVRAMTREPGRYRGAGTAVHGDVSEPSSLDSALSGCQVAYYLVHGLDRAGGARHDGSQATAFGRAAAQAGLRQLIYLGGLGSEDDNLSEHLAGRRAVEHGLRAAGVPVTVLRAALVIGAGSASFELLRQLVTRLPVLAMPPQAAHTLVQPVAVQDAIDYLVAVLDNPEAMDQVLQIGGADVVTYAELLRRTARHLAVHRLEVPLIPLPDLVTKAGIALLTDVDPQLAVSLLKSLRNDVIVTDRPATRLLPGPVRSLDQMLTAALSENTRPDEDSGRTGAGEPTGRVGEA